MDVANGCGGDDGCGRIGGGLDGVGIVGRKDRTLAMGDRDPQSVLRTYLSEVAAGNWHMLHELYAADAVVRHPFARGASALLRGREALRTHFGELAGFEMKLSARDLVLRPGADPEVVVGEFVYDGIGGDGEVFEMAACFVWRVRDGLIVEAHDYLDQPRPLAA